MLVQMLAVIFNLSITVNRMVTRLNDKLLSARKKTLSITACKINSIYDS